MYKLGYEEDFLKLKGGLWTAREIEQQPEMLRQTHAVLENAKAEIEGYLGPLLGNTATRIVLIGAGTSAFIGDILAPLLARALMRRVDAIATTDLASAPLYYFEKTTPTLFVSFGRSGNSPESVAAVALAERLVDNPSHLIITCNKDGALFKQASGVRLAHTIVLPEATHDQGFAMTSSFSSMLYAALAVFYGIDTMRIKLDTICIAMQAVIENDAATMCDLVKQHYDRVVYLGSHIFKGLAREASLKLLELSDGAVIGACDTPMGFRHGPKTIVTGSTLVVIFLSNDADTRSYDVDLLEELRRDKRAGAILIISAENCSLKNGEIGIFIKGLEAAEDFQLLFPYIIAPQIFAFQQSLMLGLTPDNPNSSGAVNRVVQGVRIHAHS